MNSTSRQADRFHRKPSAYVAAVTPLLGNEQAERAAFRIRRAIPWREAPLFVERTEAR